jgi:hypothetical protein
MHIGQANPLEHDMTSLKTFSPWTVLRSALVAAIVLALAAPALAGGDREVLPLKDARLKIEFNATDRDAGVQLFVDSEPWRSLDVYDTRGRLLLRSTARGRFALQGGTELFMESGEPSLDEVPLDVFLKRFPVGNYKIVAHGIDGQKYVGHAKFTHNIPAGPVLVAPAADAVVADLDILTLRWQGVPPPNGSPIIGYQVLVVQPDTGLPGLPKIVLDVMMPPTATSMLVPPGFLRPGSNYEWEVLAIEAGGNQTLSSALFRTRP